MILGDSQRSYGDFFEKNREDVFGMNNKKEQHRAAPEHCYLLTLETSVGVTDFSLLRRTP